MAREYYRGKCLCTIDLLFDWFGISCMSTGNLFIYKTDSSKPVKQEVNSTVILPPLVFPAMALPLEECKVLELLRHVGEVGEEVVAEVRVPGVNVIKLFFFVAEDN
jgi:hypothetical protein